MFFSKFFKRATLVACLVFILGAGAYAQVSPRDTMDVLLWDLFRGQDTAVVAAGDTISLRCEGIYDKRYSNNPNKPGSYDLEIKFFSRAQNLKALMVTMTSESEYYPERSRILLNVTPWYVMAFVRHNTKDWEGNPVILTVPYQSEMALEEVRQWLGRGCP